MKLKKFVFLLFAAALLISSLCGFTAAQSNELIRQMVLDYAYYQENARPQVDALLSRLKDGDAAKGQQWQQIMDYWSYANHSMSINRSTIPGGLSDSDNLCITVLGYQLYPDGSIRPELEGRLQTALDCAMWYPNAFVLCTGGGTASANRSVTEAGQMAEWLIRNGVDPSRIIIEDRSTTTGQNAKNSYRILREVCPQVDTMLIVSSDYHIPWGAVLFETQFILAADSEGYQPIHVVDNAAYRTGVTNHYYNYQAAGILELANMSSAASRIYSGTQTAPALD